MKCFERLVMRHIKTLLPPSLDPLQFAYCPNRSTDDAISTTVHLALTHLDNRDTYVGMLFIDFSSAFNTIIPQHLIGKLNLLGLNTSLSNWILDFLTGRPQSVRIGRNTSSTTTLSTGAPQGCVLSPLLFTLLTHDCAAVNLSLNVDKTKEMVVDFRRTRRDHSPLHIYGSTVEIAKSTKFLGVHLAEDLTWSLNTSTITKKAQQRLYFLRRLRKAHLPPPILTTFYRGTIESILSSCITAWFGNCTASDRKSLQRVVRTAEKIICVSLPTITDIYTTRCIRKATSIVDDHTHPSHTLFTTHTPHTHSSPHTTLTHTLHHTPPSHTLFTLLPSGKRLWNCNLTERSCAVLSPALSSNSSSLRELNLGYNELQDRGVKLLSAALKNPHCKLEKLGMFCCSITEEGCAALVSALKSNPSHLRELDLNLNNPGESGVKLLSELLKDPHCKLEKLHLSDCSITEEGCAALVSALKSNPSHLRELNLSSNNPGESGVKLLSDLLKDPHCKLEKLQ
ncbi:hypothetical protein NFI96_032396 [Prochilodus magdalenae]|nr:hypothetical protein NFI96_032396 [Prochilodus magdalenae]